jgi:type IV pilus assembly protein PilE
MRCPSPRASTAPARSGGFTLLELLVVMTVVAILASVAIPSYQQSVMRSRRTDARVAMNALATRLERCFTQFGTYDAEDCDIESPADSPEGFYQVSVVRDAAAYALTAEPQGAQADDTACGTLSMTSTGLRAATGETPDRCW